MSTKTNTELTTRICGMETRYDEARRMLDALDAAVAGYAALKPELETLREYQASGQWKKDFEADEVLARAKATFR